MISLEQFYAIMAGALASTGWTRTSSELRAWVPEEAAAAALAAPFEEVLSELIHAGVVEQAAILAASIIRLGRLPNNLERQVALLAAELHLEHGGLQLRALPNEIDDVFRAMARGTIGDGYFVRWTEQKVTAIPMFN